MPTNPSNVSTITFLPSPAATIYSAISVWLTPAAARSCPQLEDTVHNATLRMEHTTGSAMECVFSVLSRGVPLMVLPVIA